jgi:hypothetical protein
MLRRYSTAFPRFRDTARHFRVSVIRHGISALFRAFRFRGFRPLPRFRDSAFGDPNL